MLTIGSLFAGIGGLELGLERAIPGARTIWQVEQDPYARRVLAKHWPQANRSVTDVREVTRETVERPDILCGGWPCQDLSWCNTGANGLEGPKSGLWSECSRIISEVRPRKFVVLENVAALRFRGMGRVLGDLMATGWMGGCVWDCIPASSIGAIHHRDRWFCIAWSKEVANAQRNGRFQGAQVAQQRGEGHRTIPALCGGDDGRSPFSRWLKDSGHWSIEPGLGMPTHGLPGRLPRRGVEPWEEEVPRIAVAYKGRVAKLRCLGNSVCPQVAEVIGRLVNEIHETTHYPACDP
jgi:DNA (cytosine-5)-methyltransferase 1